MILVRGYVGNAPSVNDWAAEKQVTTKNARVSALVVVNKNAATVWVEIHDSSDGATAAATHADGGVPRYVLPVGSNQVLNLAESQFNKGVYVRAMDAASGGVAIATTDLKVTCEYMTWPVSN